MKTRMENILSDPTYFTFVAELDSQIVGMIGSRKLFLYEHDEIVIQISALVTRQHFQRKGIGTSLIHYVEKFAVKEGANAIVLTSGIKAERLKAHEFYKKMGFNITGYRFVKEINEGAACEFVNAGNVN
jgi:GNAT superfamily N-acetyltransferase